MKLSKKHAVYGSVVALGVGFLAFDQFSGSREAQGSLASPESLLIAPAAGNPTTHPSAADKAALGNEPQVAEHLEELAKQRNFDLAGTRDAFAPPPAWTPLTVAAGVADEKEMAVKNAAAFMQKHRLMSTVSSGKRAEALVDGRLLRIGEELDGYKLASISTQSAVFQSNNNRVELKFKSEIADSGASAETR